MNDQARWLVDDQQMLVLEHDVNRDVLGFGLNLALGFGQGGYQGFASFEL